MMQGAEGMDWTDRWRLVLKSVRVLSDPQQVTSYIDALTSRLDATGLAFVNAHAMNLVADSPAFTANLLRSTHLVRDGIGWKILMHLLSRPAGLNMNGTDLIPRVLQAFNGQKVALFGTEPAYLEAAGRRIKESIAPDSDVILDDGFHAPQYYVSKALETCPRVIVLGMGMPKQEMVSAMLLESLHHPCLVICGGAIIDFLGGKVTRAPAAFRSAGLEWLYRLALEPRRLFRRYVLGNPTFLVRGFVFAWRERLGLTAQSSSRQNQVD